MPRWSKEDTDAIAKVRHSAKELLAEQPAFPEVVGDRRILRFIKGHPESLEKATEMYEKFLVWRKESGCNEYRNNIATRGMDHPTKFPNADVIQKLIPCIHITLKAKDKTGAPICVDQYDFNPTEVLASIELDDYIRFAVYGLEYKMMILDQMAHESEQIWLNNLSEEDRKLALEPYGDSFPDWGYQFTRYTCVIRDLGAVGWKHLGEEGRKIIAAVISVASDNYPELLAKCIMINTPWLFTTVWPFVKGFLAQQTVEKIVLVGTDFKNTILESVDEESVPEMVGGSYKGGLDYEEFDWDKEWLTSDFFPTVLCDEDGVPQVVGKATTTTATTSETDSSLPPTPGAETDTKTPPKAP